MSFVVWSFFARYEATFGLIEDVANCFYGGRFAVRWWITGESPVSRFVLFAAGYCGCVVVLIRVVVVSLLFYVLFMFLLLRPRVAVSRGMGENTLA